MTMTSPTLEQIEAQITDRRECLSLLSDEAKDLSLLVVSGDQDATAALASINTEIRQISGDLAVLDNARLVATKQQQSASEAEVTAYRARHREIARDHAEVIVKLASRADELIAEIRAALAEISATEREIWSALREASASPQDAVVGRRGLIQFAIASLNGVANGTDRFSQARPVADVARTAWADLYVEADKPAPFADAPAPQTVLQAQKSIGGIQPDWVAPGSDAPKAVAD
jgi:hypothetical protein